MERILWFWICGALVLWAGCATTRYEEFGPAPDEPGTDAQSGMLVQKRLMAMEDRIAQLEAKLADMEASDGELSRWLSSLVEQVEELRKQIDAMGARTVPPPAEESRAKPLPQSAPFSQEANDLYAHGLRLYQERQYPEAKATFQLVMNKDPDGELADNAQYWIGECEYALEDYRMALEAFQKIFLYASTEKFDDAQLKLGLCYWRLGDTEKAFIELKRLLVDYPNSEYVGRAEDFIRRLRPQVETGP